MKYLLSLNPNQSNINYQPVKYKLSTRYGDFQKIYGNGFQTAINNASITKFYLKYLRNKKKTSTIINIPENINLNFYEKIFKILKQIELNGNDSSINVLKSICFRLMDGLLYEDYFGNLRTNRKSFHDCVDEMPDLSSNDEQSLIRLYEIISNRNSDFAVTSLLANNVEILKTIEHY